MVDFDAQLCVFELLGVCDLRRAAPAVFHDHVRIAQMLFEGVITPRHGCLHPDLSRAGTGLVRKPAGTNKFEVG